MTAATGGTTPDAVPTASGPSLVCAACGTTPVDDAAAALARATWAFGTENGRGVWTCDGCSRRYLRSIEGKLDSTWW